MVLWPCGLRCNKKSLRAITLAVTLRAWVDPDLGDPQTPQDRKEDRDELEQDFSRFPGPALHADLCRWRERDCGGVRGQGGRKLTETFVKRHRTLSVARITGALPNSCAALARTAPRIVPKQGPPPLGRCVAGHTASERDNWRVGRSPESQRPLPRSHVRPNRMGFTLAASVGVGRRWNERPTYDPLAILTRDTPPTLGDLTYRAITCFCLGSERDALQHVHQRLPHRRLERVPAVQRHELGFRVFYGRAPKGLQQLVECASHDFVTQPADPK